MGQIVGRADDMLIIRGVNLFQTQVEDVLKDIEHASAYYQLIVTKQSTMDEVEVKIEVDAALLNNLGIETVTTETLNQHPILLQLQHKIGHKIKENIGLSMTITLTHLGTMPRSEGGKLSRIVDLRKK